MHLAQCNIQLLKSPTKLTKLPVEPKLYHSQMLLQTQFQPKLIPHTSFVYQDLTFRQKQVSARGKKKGKRKKEIDKINLFFFFISLTTQKTTTNNIYILHVHSYTHYTENNLWLIPPTKPSTSFRCWNIITGHPRLSQWSLIYG